MSPSFPPHSLSNINTTEMLLLHNGSILHLHNTTDKKTRAENEVEVFDRKRLGVQIPLEGWLYNNILDRIKVGRLSFPTSPIISSNVDMFLYFPIPFNLFISSPFLLLLLTKSLCDRFVIACNHFTTAPQPLEVAVQLQ
jgi:hypothetical protein